jgi:hypothetical protein
MKLLLVLAVCLTVTVPPAAEPAPPPATSAISATVHSGLPRLT